MPFDWMTVKVKKRTLEAQSIIGLELAAIDGGKLPSYPPGSHIDVELEPGLIRQYSLCSICTAADFYRVAVLLDEKSRGGSSFIHARVKEGDLLKISAPRNNFPLDQSAAHSILIAGGIGITPLMCMAEALNSDRESFELHYFSRTQERCAFHGQLRDSEFRDNVHFHFDDSSPPDQFELRSFLETARKDSHIYVCGPSGFIDFVLKVAADSGFPPSQVHKEFFGVEVKAAEEGDCPFNVRLTGSGREIEIPVGQSIATTLLKNGIFVDVSCEQGVCGTCITRVSSGIPDHRDYYLSDAEKRENNQIAICCSRAKSDFLVLEI